MSPCINTEKTILIAEAKNRKFKVLLALIIELFTLKEKNILPSPSENKKIISIRGKLYAEEGQFMPASRKKTISIDNAKPPEKNAKVHNFFSLMASSKSNEAPKDSRFFCRDSLEFKSLYLCE